MPRPTTPAASPETTAPAQALVPPASVAFGSHGVVHASSIAMIAIAETGDAALTADKLGELRLWPTLDGSRESVPISTPAPATHAAIASGTELVVALADEPGDVALWRIGHDGTLHGTAQVVSDVGVEQLAFVGSEVLVRRRDETIECYASNGVRVGRVAAAAGERLGAIATRGRAAIVAIERGDEPVAQLRWLALEHGLAWGASVALSEPIAREPLAISPDGRWLAAKQPPELRKSAYLVVFEFGPTAHREDAKPVVLMPGARLGFLDNDNLAIANNGFIWWWTHASMLPPSAIPGAGSPVPTAIGDRMVLTAFASGLVLSAPSHMRYLGWKQLAQGVLQATGARVALATCTSCQARKSAYLWFDDNLVATAHFTLTMHEGVDAYYSPIAVGEHELAVLEHGAIGWRAWLGDANDPRTRVDLTTPALSATDLRYDEGTRVLAIIDHRASTLYRYRIKLDPLAASALPSISLPSHYIDVRLVDPERAHGAVAIAVLGGDQTQIQTLYEDPRKAPDLHKVDGNIAAVDSTGTVFTITPHDGVIGSRDGHVIVELSPAERPLRVVSSSDGDLVALVSADAVELFDRGASRWKHAVWAPSGAAMSSDGRRVFVQTKGGVLALDARDGAIVARACGLDFGLYDEPLTTSTLGAPPVCAE